MVDSILTKHEIDLNNLTEEQVDNVMNNTTLRPCEITTPNDMGVESDRKVRICGVMKYSDVYEYCKQARSQMHCTGTVVNFIADFVLRETIQRLKADGLFKHETKKICNGLQIIIKSWKADMKFLLDVKYESIEDISCDRMSELNGKIEQLRMQIKQGLAKAKCKHFDTASWVELTQQMFVLSHQVVKAVVNLWYQEANIDFSEVFRHMDLFLKCSRRWQRVCMSLYTQEQQTNLVQSDINVINALKILSVEACDYDGLWQHFQTALEEHAEAFSDEDRANINADVEYLKAQGEAKRRAAEKANADYWAHNRKTAKPRASDVTTEDIELLKQHFA